MIWLRNPRISTDQASALILLFGDSIQNKFDKLKLLNRGLKSQIIILSEMKIDSSYKSDQFRPQGYQMYRKERKPKGGGGLIAYIYFFNYSF